MQKLNKLLSALLFTILLLIIGSVIWSFFNPYVRVVLIPLGVLSIYYLLLVGFTKLVGVNDSKLFFYTGIVLIILPLLAVGMAYDRFIAFSASIVNHFIN